MPDLEKELRCRRERGRKLLIPYLMGGMTEDWGQSLAAVVAAGADAVEVGIPFSDPMMDGPVIQEAALRALARGTMPEQVLDGIARAEAPVPVAVMTYYNIVFRAGHKRMARSLAAAGVGGAILPDLPIEELGSVGGRGRWGRGRHRAAGCAVEPARAGGADLRPGPWLRLCGGAHGRDRRACRPRVRCGARSSERVREHTDMPVCVGIGVSTPAQAAEVCEVADGVVVGSALVRRLLEGGGPEGAAAFVGSLREAID